MDKAVTAARVLTRRCTVTRVDVIAVAEVTLLARLSKPVAAARVLTRRGTVVVVAVVGALVTLLAVSRREDAITTVTSIADAVVVGVSLC